MLGSLLLTRGMERRRQIGLDFYDRFFPSRNTMPKGGFGNPIALATPEDSSRIGEQRFH
jgi:hypothetical protein